MRVGIVSDAPTTAEALRRIVTLRPDYDVIWIARNGDDAVAQCIHDHPDIVLMDLIMSGMSGVEATRRIMAEAPCAILIVTANVGTNATGVFEAMGYGAVDAMDTPTFSHGDPGAGAAMLLDKLERIRKNITGGTEMLRTIAMPVVPGPTASTKQLVAIGASAGGPAALARLLSALPQPFPAATIIVQHVDGRFSSGLADWLSQQSSHTVSLADAGDRPIAGTVLLARGDDHLRLGRTGLLEYTSEPREYAYRPSVDVFFQSICDFWPHDAVGVLLTGMGRDGAVGLKSLRDKGWPTIAQDEATSIVYGMPKAAARLNAADEILPLDQIAPRLAAIAARSGRLQAMRQ